jgi:multidrug efflux pump subunit AcrB/CRP-like cAMP-binding protein
MSNIEHIYGTSQNGKGTVMVMFEIGSDREQSLLDLHDRVIQNSNIFPSGASKPIVKPLDVNEIPIVSVAIHSDTLDEKGLYQRALDLIHPLSIHDDISIVGIKGGHSREIRVEVEPQLLQSYGVSFGDVLKTLQNSSKSIGLGEFSKTSSVNEIEFRGFIENISEIENLRISTSDGRKIKLGEVATVSDSISNTHKRSESYILEGNSSKYQVTLHIAKKSGTNAVVVSNIVKERFFELQARYGDFDYTVTKDDGAKANSSVNLLIEHVFLAIGIIVILLLFSLGWREGLIVAFTVPIILGITLFIGLMADQTINRITLFALIVALGLLVDDTIVVIENIHRHFSMKERSKRDAIIFATNEIGNPTILATFAVIATFIPMGFVTGMMGPYMAPIPFNVPVSMLASLIIAFIFGPWLAFRFLPYKRELGGDEHHFDIKETSMYKFLNWLFGFLLSAIWKRWLFLGVLVNFLLISIALIVTTVVPFKMLPDGNQNAFSIDVELPYDATKEETRKVVSCIQERLLAEPEVRDIEIFYGESGVINFPAILRAKEFKQGDYIAQVDVNLIDKHHRKEQSHEIVSRIRSDIQSCGGERDIIKMIQEPAGPPVPATVVAEIYGETASGREALADDVYKKMLEIEGVVDTTIWNETNADKFTITPYEEMLEQFGISRGELMELVYPAIYGQGISTIHDGSREETPIFVRYKENYLETPETLERLLITLGDMVFHLGDVAKIERVQREKTIYSKDLQEMIMVSAEMNHRGSIYALFDLWSKLESLEGYALESVENLRQDIVLKSETGEKLHIKWTGEWKLTFDVFRDLGGAFIGAVAIIFLLLMLYYKDFKMSILVVALVPPVLIGVIFGHWFMGLFGETYFTATSMIGFIALAGIVVRNNNLLVDYTTELIHAGHSINEAVVLGSATRSRPIILTALAIIFGSVIILTDPIWQGLAISLVFGTVGATILTIFVTPLLYWGMNKKFVAGLDLTELESKIELLSKVRILNFMDRKSLFQLAKQAEQRVFKKGEAVIRQYESGNSMFLLVDGSLSVFIQNSRKEALSNRVAELSTGSFFGEGSLLTGDERSATIVADTDIITFEITETHLKELSTTHSHLLEQLAYVVVERKMETREFKSEEEKSKAMLEETTRILKMARIKYFPNK